MAQSKALVPNFLWAQDKSNVYVKIDLTDVREKDMKVEITKDGLEFSGTSHDKLYTLSFKFRRPINPETARYSVKRLVSFLLEKEDPSIWWPHLLAEDDKKKYKMACKIDWEKFIDEDDAKKKGLDMSGDDWQNYQGGGGGFPGMEGMEGMGATNDDIPEDDSDSEDNEDDNDDAPIDGIDDALNEQKDAQNAEHAHDHAHGHDHPHDHTHDHAHAHAHDHSHAGHEHCTHDHSHKQEEAAKPDAAAAQQEQANEEIEEVN